MELAALARRIVHDPRVQRAEGLRGWWQRWVGSIAFVVIVLTAGIGLLYVQGIANANNRALCALRGDLETRVAQTEKFLKHPEDFPQFNDPATVALIQQQVDGQQRTIDALSIVPCD